MTALGVGCSAMRFCTTFGVGLRDLPHTGIAHHARRSDRVDLRTECRND